MLTACGAAPTASPEIFTSTPQPIESLLPPAQTLPPSQPALTLAAPPQPPTKSAVSFPDPSAYEWKLIAGGLSRPVDIQSANDGSGRLFVIEKYGVIRILKNGQLQSQPFLDITDRVNDSGNEMGLLGLAFHPDYEQNHFFFVNYTGSGGNTRISRFQSDGAEGADPNSESVLMVIDQPFPNHNGGALAFGPDAYLYAGLGDGGAAGDPLKNGQNKNSFLGKILRINVNEGVPYSIPQDNPFGTEVWAYGLRNPWRMSFDRQTGDLWIGDVGQGLWEEINLLAAGTPAGVNFGWSVMEGTHEYDGSMQPEFLPPVSEYEHTEGRCSVTGGYVYRGSMPEWQGIYLYGDYCRGTIWGLIPVNGTWQSQVLFETGSTITTFGQDEAGEIFFASDNGGIYQLANK